MRVFKFLVYKGVFFQIMKFIDLQLFQVEFEIQDFRILEIKVNNDEINIDIKFVYLCILV